MEKTVDNINHPAHYNTSPAHCSCGRRIECIDITQHMDFCLGNAVKYIWRHKYKNGKEDLAKARWYLNKSLEMHGEKRKVLELTEEEQDEVIFILQTLARESCDEVDKFTVTSGSRTILRKLNINW